VETLRAVQDPGARGSEGAGRRVRGEGGPAGVPDSATVDVGGGADVDDEERPVHPRADEAGVPGQEEPQGQERHVRHGTGHKVAVVVLDDQHAVPHDRQAVRHELWHIVTLHRSIVVLGAVPPETTN
jgi:hypothetical protein